MLLPTRRNQARSEATSRVVMGLGGDNRGIEEVIRNLIDTLEARAHGVISENLRFEMYPGAELQGARLDEYNATPLTKPEPRNGIGR